MSDTLETEIRRGEHAASLLNDELLTEAFATIEKEYTEQWLNSPARDSEAREKLWLSLKLLQMVRGHLQSTLETGQIARATLAERVGQTFKRLF
jgi:hypothetical protein